MHDAFGLGEHTILARLWVTADGTKVPLGVAVRSTEHAAVATRLLADLTARGLDADKGVLFVIDGRLAPPPRPSVTSTAARPSPLAADGTRNAGVLDHLPEAQRPLTQRRLAAAWASPDPAAARAELDALARALAKKRPGAAASSREGLEKTLTVNRLGSLLKTCDSGLPRREHDRDRLRPRPERQAPDLR